MAALTKDRAAISTVGKLDGGGDRLTFDMAAAEQIFRGSFVSENAGDVEPANTNAQKGVIGVSLENVNNTGSAGDLTTKVLVAPLVRHILAAVTKTDIGAKVFCSDDQTLTLVSTSNSKAGIIVAVPAAGEVIMQMGFPGQVLP